IPAGIGQFAIIQAMAPSLGLEVSAINELDADNIEHEVMDFAVSPSSGLIVTASAISVSYLDLIVGLAAKHKLPAVYYRRYTSIEAARSLMGMMSSNSSGALPTTLIVSSRVRNRPSCPYRRRTSTI